MSKVEPVITGYGNSFIEIETDYEYVANDITQKAARFLLDFYSISGPLKSRLLQISMALEDTAKDFLEIQGIDRQTNLSQGIHAIVRGNAIELRSSAYKLPRSPIDSKHERGNKRRSGARQRKNGDIVGFNRYPWNRGVFQHEATQMISPQGVDLVGATGGVHSLLVSKGYDYTRYKKTGNIQYYGGHVEFGHRTRDGGGIGFVEARPHLRPALRAVADESRGLLSTTMAYMLQGLGNEFETRRISGQQITGMTFGNRFNSPYDATINKNKGSRFSELHNFVYGLDARKIREAYSVRTIDSAFYRNSSKSARYAYEHKARARNINFGKKVKFSKYGYSEDIRAAARAAQQKSDSWIVKGTTYLDQVKGSKHYSKQTVKKQSVWRGIAPGDRAYVKMHYNQRTVGRKLQIIRAKSAASNNKKKTNTSTKKSVGKGKGKGNSKGRGTGKGKSSTKGGKKSTKVDRQKNLLYGDRGSRRKRNNMPEPNPGGKDPLKPTRPSDFMLSAKPTKEFAKEIGMTAEEYKQWKKDYNEEKRQAAELSRQHNDKIQQYTPAQEKWLREHGLFNEG